MEGMPGARGSRIVTASRHDISVVITTFNRSAGLARLLGCLGQQRDTDFQVVVGIDGSTDDTEAMLAALRPPFDLKWVNTHSSSYGLAQARNLGILAADGRIVVVLDDDSFPEPGFIEAHRAAARARTITAGARLPSLSADTRMLEKADKLRRMPPLTPMRIDEVQRRWPDLFLIENNVSLLRQDWIDVGMFSERLRLYGFIGQEFIARARHFGFSYQFAPDATVIHHGELEGDNDFHRSRKWRQARLSALIRPSLMTPRHYEAQAAWACAQAAGEDCPPWPGFRLHAALRLPYRWLRRTLAELWGGARMLTKRSAK